MSPVSSTDTSRQRSSSTSESSLRTFCRSQSAGSRMPRDDVDAVDRDAIAAVDIRPPRAAPFRVATRSTVSGVEPRHRNALPHLARPELAQDRGGAADVIGIAVRQRDADRSAGIPRRG